MLADQVTRCPHCQAVYRVTSEQLTRAQGWLRCGQCHQAFDSSGLQVLWQPELDESQSRVDIQDLLQKEDRSSMTVTSSAGAALQSFEQALATFPLPPQVPVPPTLTDSEESVPSHSQLPNAPASSLSQRVGIFVLALLMLLQLGWLSRAAWWQTSWIAASAQSVCTRLGCSWPALREPEQLMLDSSRLLRAQEGYRLEWTLSNRSVWPVQMPAIELVLTDPADAPLVRRVVPAAEMVAPQRLEPGQQWEGALLLQPEQGLELSGYRLRVFYP